jgi:hypothetical protein
VGQEQLRGANGLPAGYTTTVPAGTTTNASRFTGSAVLAGSADLRLDAADCPTCVGVDSDAVSVAPGKVAVFRFWERNAFVQTRARPPDASFRGAWVSLHAFSGAMLLGSLLDLAAWNTNFTWLRYLGVAPIGVPKGVLLSQFSVTAESSVVIARKNAIILDTGC